MRNQQVPKPALPLLFLLALASLLGVVVAVALAGAAMLLAAPAYADDGRLLLERQQGLAHAELLFVHYDSRAEHTRVVEAYRNPFDDALTGVYLYRLPSKALLQRLEVASHSAQPRHAVLRRRQTSAIVEPIATIAPGETLYIELEYRTPKLPALH